MSEWEEFKLGDLCEVKGGKRLPKGELLVNYDTGHPYIRVTDLGSKWISKKGLLFVESKTQKIISRYIVNSGDVILSIVGSIGFIARISSELHEANLTENCVKLILKTKSIDNDFLYYFLISKIGQDEIDKRVVGSTQPKLPIYNIKDIDILLPLIPEQTAIAEVLSSLDDKIDLLHRQNKTLEQLAETLFRQWFVEEIEESWENFRIGDMNIVINDFVANGSFASLKENVTLYPEVENYALFIRNTDLKNGFKSKVFVDKHSYEFLSKTKLFGGEVIISNVADVGSVFLCPQFDRPMTLGNNVIMLNSEYNLFLYLYFNSPIGQGLINGITSGSAQQKFNKTDFRNSTINIPSIKYILDFNKEVKLFYKKIEKNQNQIQTITELRDTLLPKLMSGEVRVNSKRIIN